MRATHTQERRHLHAKFLDKFSLQLLYFLGYGYVMGISQSESIMPPEEEQSCTGTSTPLDVNVLRQAS